MVTDGSIVNLVMAEEVIDVAESLDLLDKNGFRRRYEAAPPAFPGGFRSMAGRYLDEFYEKLAGLRNVYRSAAQEGRAVLFYTDDPLDYFFSTDSAP